MDITDNMELVLGLFERKNPHLFEERLVPGLKFEDLDPATFKFCRNAATTLNPLHPWQDMTDMEILESCRLVKRDNSGLVSQNEIATETANEIAIETARVSLKTKINAVYAAIKANPDISVSAICSECKISRATTARVISLLKENGYIDRTSVNQYGRWIILK